MKKDFKTIAVVGALIAPTVCGALVTEFYYVFRWKTEWLSFGVYSLTLLAALVFLFRTFTWPWWKKLVAAIPFCALSLIATIYVSLIVAAAHGDAL